MKKVELRGKWLIKAPKNKVYDVISDFEQSVKLFPDVAKSMTVLERNGNHLKIEAKTQSSKLGPTFTVHMDTQLNPPHGFHSKNTASITMEDENVTLEETDEGTYFVYKNDVIITNRFLRPLGNLLIGKVALKFWEKKYIAPLRKLLEK
ncbi:hypothetical protein HY004_00050 [Candidatus Saccharibacteria bacterium]|nr:hypothetical protein [Candidatus Saccharibacteria bacterium]